MSVFIVLLLFAVIAKTRHDHSQRQAALRAKLVGFHGFRALRSRHAPTYEDSMLISLQSLNNGLDDIEAAVNRGELGPIDACRLSGELLEAHGVAEAINRRNAALSALAASIFEDQATA